MNSKKIILIAAIALLSIQSKAAEENIAGTAYTVDFGRSSITGAGRTIKVGSLPLSTGGKTVYFNTTFDFKLMPDGTLTALLVAANQVDSAAQITSDSNLNFQTGSYTEAGSGCKYYLDGSQAVNGTRTYTMTRTGSRTSTTSDGACFSTITWSTDLTSGNPYYDLNACTGYNTNTPKNVALGRATPSSQYGIVATASNRVVSVSSRGCYGDVLSANTYSFLKD